MNANTAEIASLLANTIPAFRAEIASGGWDDLLVEITDAECGDNGRSRVGIRRVLDARRAFRHSFNAAVGAAVAARVDADDDTPDIDLALAACLENGLTKRHAGMVAVAMDDAPAAEPVGTLTRDDDGTLVMRMPGADAVSSSSPLAVGTDTDTDTADLPAVADVTDEQLADAAAALPAAPDVADPMYVLGQSLRRAFRSGDADAVRDALVTVHDAIAAARPNGGMVATATAIATGTVANLTRTRTASTGTGRSDKTAIVAAAIAAAIADGSVDDDGVVTLTADHGMPVGCSASWFKFRMWDAAKHAAGRAAVACGYNTRSTSNGNGGLNVILTPIAADAAGA